MIVQVELLSKKTQVLANIYFIVHNKLMSEIFPAVRSVRVLYH